MFRKLKAHEIEVRVQSISYNDRTTKKDPKGAILLVYKDARCDMNILDETVGSMNWQRHHTRDNKNCIVSIYDKEKGIWVSKEDTGAESNSQAEKGLASDSFKRACFNWGIGRELYTAGFIWVNRLASETPYEFKNQSYKVVHIKYKGDDIDELTIVDKNNVVRFNKKGISDAPDIIEAPKEEKAKPKSKPKPQPKAEEKPKEKAKDTAPKTKAQFVERLNDMAINVKNADTLIERSIEQLGKAGLQDLTLEELQKMYSFMMSKLK